MHKNIVLSDIDDVLLNRLKIEADKQGTDLKTLIISIIRKSFGIVKTSDNKNYHNDLDHLAGTWTQEEYDEFNHNIGELDSVDKDLWK